MKISNHFTYTLAIEPRSLEEESMKLTVEFPHSAEHATIYLKVQHHLTPNSVPNVSQVTMIPACLGLGSDMALFSHK